MFPKQKQGAITEPQFCSFLCRDIIFLIVFSQEGDGGAIQVNRKGRNHNSQHVSVLTPDCLPLFLLCFTSGTI
jgi:hypothetical protein